MSYMKIALDEAYKGIRNGDGGPFGAVIVRNGEVIGQGHNKVLADHDPTMHGEVAAIRNACSNIGTHSLNGCTLYTSAYPCPMCMSAALWAGIEKIVYGCTVNDTADIGFKDDDFYEAIKSGEPIPLECDDRDECLELFKEYNGLRAQRY